MKNILPILFILFCTQGFAQTKLGKPQFKLAGFDSGTVSSAAILANPKLTANDTSLKIVSFEMTGRCLTGDKTYTYSCIGSFFTPEAIALLNIPSRCGPTKIVIDNVKVKHRDGKITFLQNPLILKVK
ncbi:MAG TPA: hypothetical protein VKG26_09545 [Bacteroidia bacterium]|nr:hypothetical protein [Bacteroidia bacterium]